MTTGGRAITTGGRAMTTGGRASVFKLYMQIETNLCEEERQWGAHILYLKC